MPSLLRGRETAHSWWKQPTIYLGLWLLTYMAASFIPWGQLLGYRSLVFFTRIGWLSSPPLKAFVDWCGEPRHAVIAMAAGTTLLTVQFWPSQIPRWRGREAAMLLIGCLILLGTALILPELGWHIDHGYFPHEATFPSGHMSGFLCTYLAIWAIGSRPWRRRVDFLLLPATLVIGGAIVAQSAHTPWDVLGPTSLTLATRSLIQQFHQHPIVETAQAD